MNRLCMTCFSNIEVRGLPDNILPSGDEYIEADPNLMLFVPIQYNIAERLCKGVECFAEAFYIHGKKLKTITVEYD